MAMVAAAPDGAVVAVAAAVAAGSVATKSAIPRG